MIKKKAYVLVGASGSGKSTVRRVLSEKLGDSHTTICFSLDDCRLKFYLDNAQGYDGTPNSGLTQGDMYGKAFSYCNEHHKEFDAYVSEQWKEALNWEAVIVDNVNSTRKSRAKWIDGLRKNKFHVTIVEVQTPLEVIIARQATRGDKSVAEDIVRSQYMRQEEAMVGSECDALIVVDGTKPISQHLF